MPKRIQSFRAPIQATSLEIKMKTPYQKSRNKILSKQSDDNSYKINDLTKRVVTEAEDQNSEITTFDSDHSELFKNKSSINSISRDKISPEVIQIYSLSQKNRLNQTEYEID